MWPVLRLPIPMMLQEMSELEGTSREAKGARAQQQDRGCYAAMDWNSLFFDYQIKGKNEALKPVRVFDDGQKTFIQINHETQTREAPVLVVRGKMESRKW